MPYQQQQQQQQQQQPQQRQQYQQQPYQQQPYQQQPHQQQPHQQQPYQQQPYQQQPYQQQQYMTRGGTTERMQSMPIMTRGPPSGSWVCCDCRQTNMPGTAPDRCPVDGHYKSSCCQIYR